MRTSSTSLTASYSSNVCTRARGFTLVELLISIAIISVISALVIVKFSAFDSTVLLKSAAYEVALSLRDAQVYSISVHGQTGQFDYPYGVHFVPGNTYTFFRDSVVGASPPIYLAGTDTNINTFTIGRSIVIQSVCVTNSAGSETCATSASNPVLDISFRRPEFSALFYSNLLGGGIVSSKIKLQSTTGTEVWVVEVGLLGQISVYKQ